MGYAWLFLSVYLTIAGTIGAFKAAKAYQDAAAELHSYRAADIQLRVHALTSGVHYTPQ